MRGIVVPLTEERDVETLRQISLLLERENQRLITKNLQLTAELARLRGLPEVAQLTFAVEQTLQQTRAAILDGAAVAPPPPPAPAAGPRAARATGLADRRGATRAARRSARVSGLRRDAHRARRAVRDGRAHHHGEGDVSRRAPCPAEIPVCV